MNARNFSIVEGTTHYINIDCFHEDTKEKYDLTGYKVLFFLTDNNCHTGFIEKEAKVSDNTIMVKIEPNDTVKKSKLQYDCRIFDENGDIFHVVSGEIRVSKPTIPIKCIMHKYPN